MKKKLIYFLFMAIVATMTAQPTGWSHLKVYQVTENSGANITDYQLAITLNTQNLVSLGQMKSDGSDIRFGNDCVGTILYPYWIENNTMNTTATTIWVKIDNLPASANRFVYLYYGNNSATAVSAINGTFVGPHSATDSVASGVNSGYVIANTQRGFRFSPNEDILVSSFGKREPNGSTRYITLFNFSTQAIIEQTQVSGPAAQYSYSSLPNPIWLMQNTQYLLEMYQASGNGYYFGTSNQIGEHLTYFDVRYCNNCTENTFPTAVLTNYHYGYPDLWYYTKKNVSPAPTYIEYNYTNSTVSAPNMSITSPSTGSTVNVCVGSSVTLSCLSAGVAEYLWYKNGVAVNYQNGGPGTYTVSATNSGIDEYNLKVVYSGAVCASILSTTATVIKHAPTATISPTGSTTFCANTPTTLHATTGMSSYVWKRGSTTVGTSSSYIPTVSGNHNVTVTDVNGCTKTSAIVGITVKAVPPANAGADKALCAGSQVAIGSTGSSIYTYTWSPTTGLSNAYIANPIAYLSGNYTLTVNNPINACSNTDAVAISALVIPQMPTISSVQNGNLITISSNTPGASTINWYRDGVGLYSNKMPNSSISVQPSNPTKAYTVRSKGENGCLSMPSAAVNVRMGDEKGGDMLVSQENIMEVYPNPVTQMLNVKLQNSLENEGKLLLYNNIGQLVFTQNINLLNGSANETLDLQNLAAGIYNLTFQTVSSNIVRKIVKE